MIARPLLVGASLLAAVAVGSPTSAVAIPFSMTFNGSVAGGVGPNGTGSFEWDPSTMTMSNFDWRFNPGQVGQLTPTGLDFGAFLFDNIFFNPGNPLTDSAALTFGASTPPRWAGSFPTPTSGSSVQFCWGNTQDCGILAGANSVYEFEESVPPGQGGGSVVIARGVVSVAQASVPAPATLALLVIALGALAFARRKLA